MDMKKKIITSILTCFILAFAHGSFAKDVVATVNGKKITKQDLDAYLQYRQKTSKQKIDNSDALVHEMVNRELLYTEAKKQKLDKNKELNYILEQQKRDIYIQALIANSDVAKPVSDDEIKKIYDENIKPKKIREFNVKHILVKTEGEAKTVIAELDGGAVFEDVAKSKSIEQSGKQGGAIGWVNSAQLQQMPAMAQALSEMKKGSYSKAPVKTTYGWHVLKLEDSRNMQPPPFEKVKPQIASAIRQQRLKEYVSSIRDKAKIDIAK
jgi:peptidyl-prolyl cis-trans isomerase C